MVGIFIWAGHDGPVGGTHSFVQRDVYWSAHQVVQGMRSVGRYACHARVPLSPLRSFRNVCGLAHAVRVHVHACMLTGGALPLGHERKGQVGVNYVY